jgi:hypothetical protein
LPDKFQIRDPKLRQNSLIKVAKITTQFQEWLTGSSDNDSAEQKDFRAIFSQECLQYLSARLDPRVTARKGGHPGWDLLVNIVHETTGMSDISCPEGMTRTRNEMVRTLATNISNIWSGNTYFSLKRAIVRYMTRLFLRPVSEAKYRENKKRRAQEKQARVAARQGKVRRRCQTSDKRLRSLLNQLDRAMYKPVSNPMSHVTRVQRLIRLISHPVEMPSLPQPATGTFDEQDEGSYDPVIGDEMCESDEDESDGFEEARQEENRSSMTQGNVYVHYCSNIIFHEMQLLTCHWSLCR